MAYLRVKRVKLTIEFEDGAELTTTADGSMYSGWGLAAITPGLSSRMENMIAGFVRSMRERDERQREEKKRGDVKE